MGALSAAGIVALAGTTLPLGFELKDVIDVGVSILGGGVVGWLITARFYRLQLPHQQPLWSRRTAPIVGPDAADVGLDVSFKGKPTPVVSLSRIAIWNAGRSGIDGKEIRELDPLRIEAEKPLLGSVKRLQPTNAVKFEPGNELSGNSFGQLLEFDYLGPGQGALFQVVHTGTGPGSVKVKGEFKSCKLRRVQPQSPMNRLEVGVWTSSLALIVGFGIYNALLQPIQTWDISILNRDFVISHAPVTQFLVSAGFGLLLIVAIILLRDRRKESADSLPKDLRDSFLFE